jgi:4'-phosphopantetheinyl transferase
MALEVDVYIVDTVVEQARLPRYESLLSAGEKARAAGFRFYRDRSRFVLMHGILRLVLSGRLGIPAGKIDFTEGEYGKPGAAGGFEFNISYSGDVGLIAVTRVPVGVDVEMVDPEKITPEMIVEVFSSNERESFFGDASLDVTDSFFRGWVRKESVIKSMGTGVSFPLQLVESRLDRDDYTSSYDGTEFWTCDLEGVAPGYRAALTVASRGLPASIGLKPLPV